MKGEEGEGGRRQGDRGERKEAPGEAACHLNNTLDTFNLPEHKREGFNAQGARKAHAVPLVDSAESS